jgi:hypothetical protein
MTAARSFLSQAKRNTTFLCLPDRRVDGAAPARQVSDSASGNRARQSPISASSAAAHPTGSGQGGEDGRIGMGAKALHDLTLKLVDLGPDRVQGRDQAQGHHGPGFTLWAGQPGRSVGQPPEQLGCGLAPGIAHAPQERRQPGLGQPGRLGHRGEAAQKGQRDRAVDIAEQRGGAREGDLQVGPELVGNATRVATSDLRARLTTRKATVLGVSGTSGTSRCPSVRSASAST